MTKKTWMICVCVVVAIIGASAGLMLVLSPDGPVARERVGNDLSIKSTKEMALTRKVERIRQRKANERRRLLEAMREAGKKPRIDLDADEFAGLNELQREVMRNLQDALDADDFERVKFAISRIREMGFAMARKGGRTDWMRYVPLIMRQKAVESAGWFGADAMPELVEFLADPDADVAQQAMDWFEQAMQDFSLSDYEKSDIIKSVCQIVTDEDFVDWMFTEAQNSRHSVGIDTFLYINQNGTDVAKGKVAENIEFFTGEDDIQTEADAVKWLEENPDDPDDDEFYGGDEGE